MGSAGTKIGVEKSRLPTRQTLCMQRGSNKFPSLLVEKGYRPDCR
jgi:hypothetical protein